MHLPRRRPRSPTSAINDARHRACVVDRPMRRIPALAVLIVLAGSAAFGPTPALAQYKWVGPGGTVTYSDLPPPPGVQATSLSKRTPRAAPDETQSTPPGALHGALGQAAAKYPVVLYTARECAPCQLARAHLAQRGVPFAERTIETQDDAQAFKQLGFTQPSVPAVATGRERVTGFEPEQWNRLLDAAQYPSSAKLPTGYRQAPAQRLAGAAPQRKPEDGPSVQGDAGTASGDTPSETPATALRTRAAAASPASAIRPSASTLRF